MSYHAQMRNSEWRCRCYSNIRAASCAQCLRCGDTRPPQVENFIAETWDAIKAHDIYLDVLRKTENHTAAMAAVLDWADTRK